MGRIVTFFIIVASLAISDSAWAQDRIKSNPAPNPPSIKANELDSEGDRGQLNLIVINSKHSNNYGRYHGSARIKSAKSPNTKPSVATETYYWGGQHCSGKTLSESEVDLLMDIVTHKLSVTPKFVAGNGDRKCLVAFSVHTF